MRGGPHFGAWRCRVGRFLPRARHGPWYMVNRPNPYTVVPPVMADHPSPRPYGLKLIAD